MTFVFGRALAALSIGLAAVALPVAASAATPLTFTNSTGGATTFINGSWILGSTDATYSVLRFINNETVTFGGLTDLNFDFKSTFGGVGGGAPRVAVVLDTDAGEREVLFHAGPSPNFVGGIGAYQSGNLIGLNDAGRWDLSDLGGSQYTDYNAALAAAGAYNVVRFSVIVDSYGGANKKIIMASDGLRAAGNITAAVPEPATWAMMIGGFGMAGAVLRRKRALAAA